MNEDLPFHEAANIFPMMAGKDLDELVEDIRKHGQREPVELLDNKILDGRNRYKACQLAGVDPEFIEAPPAAQEDPVAYVVSKNLHRRHLDESQRGMCAARARAVYDQQAKERMQAGKKPDPMDNLPQGAARDQAAKAVGVSGRTVDYATRVLKNAVPELVKAVDEGRVAVSTAAKAIPTGVEEQKRLAANGKSRRKGTTGGDGRPRASNEAHTALQFAQMAISQLERIKRGDPELEKALTMVERWIHKRREK